ncbi:MAG: glycine oxidase ThiO [Vicinamibacterales bacterium]
MAHADVLVIGAGIVGCATAHALAAAGHTVQMVDAREPGQGATQASAGVLAPYIEGHESGVLCTLGRRSLDLFDSLIARLAEDVGPLPVYERRGSIELAFDIVARTRLQRAGEALGAVGVEARWLTASEVATLEPAVGNGARGGLHVPMHGLVGAAALTAALEAAATRRGARFRSGVQVTGIARGSANRVAVTTSAGVIEAEHAVLASGSWAGQVAVEDAGEIPVRPVRGQLLHLSLPTRRLTHVVWGTHCYLVPWPDGSVLVGATVEDVGFDERATVLGVTGLLEAACALVPELSRATFVGVRVGLRPASPDALPIVGPSATVPGLIYATGHFRNGVLLAPLTALLVRHLIDGAHDDPALAMMAPSRLGL